MSASEEEETAEAKAYERRITDAMASSVATIAGELRALAERCIEAETEAEELRERVDKAEAEATANRALARWAERFGDEVLEVLEWAADVVATLEEDATPMDREHAYRGPVIVAAYHRACMGKE